ncbi:MarR family transcriptional regulator [Brachybacterium sp. DNPG3]
MLVLSFSPHRSRRGDDPLPALAEALAPIGLRRPVERTLGRDAIALADRAESALDAVRAAAELGGWCVGVGVGPVDLPLPEETRAVSGGGAEASAAALRDARATSQVPLSVQASDERHASTAADAEGVLRLIGWMVATRNRGQWRAVHALREHPRATQQELAELLGITQQTVSRAIKTSGWREESAAVPLVERLLSMIDLTSRS